ncbi:bifunctional phosphopantothenoylcysteine decarboxylase/phosphopantothenate--cysteine ligase CoaBC [Motilibacter aurantiacus]|uniref:bifunctional phosphopantothenoylcysteine decarboxylase/phosphopantothenate--cysteine ligase CoaBC n=1 Tax=Motilibacter aurantiacus TaxID=2714955 RepID=UPI00140CBD9E|nr:bifunctional phosphopantothenoylcysteine decarboxylase/phosphopantothenate--cysteine ligase CoaBC [Motilibacter aurantiacus]NHC45986.1 bifunctional phosphopantothenoylcysteine decarboxylase/phosphopantothenate--cysteine ligase CoaBC [Motilibacter aurantiacus]
MAEIVLGVTGGIAAYKACELLRRLREAGHGVTVVPTDAALRFVGAPTWEALSGRPVRRDVWSDAAEVPHVRIGRSADLVVVAPATADLLARAAHGLADDLLTNVLLTARCPVLFAPAMHTEMWEHPATRANVALLRERGVQVLDPAVGRLTGADSGPGRLPEPAQIAEACRRALARAGSPGALHDLAGRRVVVSAGGTREHLDPVRFLGNRSSGRQGWALATTALARGARVDLVAANVALPAPAGANVVPVGSAADLHDAVLGLAAGADAVVMAAAVADFRPVARADAKIKKAGSGAPPIELEQTPDVLAGLVQARDAGRLGAPVLVGFAAETGDESADVLTHGRAKLARKRCDLLVVNEVGDGARATGFESPDNAGVVLGLDGSERAVPPGPKEALADVVWDAVGRLLAR